MIKSRAGIAAQLPAGYSLRLHDAPIGGHHLSVRVLAVQPDRRDIDDGIDGDGEAVTRRQVHQGIQIIENKRVRPTMAPAPLRPEFDHGEA